MERDADSERHHLLSICALPDGPLASHPKACTMDPQRPLTYLSAKPIFGNFNFIQRQSLSKKCPSTRRWNRTFPFRFNKVVINNDYVEIDNLKWTFDPYHKFNPNDGADEEANRNCPTKKFIANERIPLTITNPAGKKFFFENKELLGSLIEYYINRKGNEIRLLEIHRFWVNMQDLVDVKVCELILEKAAVACREDRERFMNSFKNNEFDKVGICGSRDNKTLVEQLKDMNIKHLELHFGTSNDLRIQEFDFERIVFKECAYPQTFNGLLFLDRITLFIARSYDKTFEYLLDFLFLPEFDPNVIVNMVKERWGAKHKYDNYDGVLAFDMNDDWQIVISCYLGQLGPWTGSCLVNTVALKATIMEKQTLVPAAELSNYRRILRRMHIWQCSVTELIDSSWRLQNYCHKHKRLGECLFFLNNYHLRSIIFLIFFGFYRLVFSVLSMLGFSLGTPLSFLASLVLSSIANYLFLLPYKYDCRKEAIWDIAAE